jgi:hypothetical protein
VSADETPPVTLRVVRGTPSDEEVAALVVVLASRPGAPDAPPPVGPSAWTTSTRGGRSLPPPGPGAWLRSGRPG